MLQWRALIAVVASLAILASFSPARAQLVGEIPDVKKAVFIAAPHTSNWDGFWFIVYKFAVDVEVRFLGKHTLFWWPLGRILSAIGCMPVDRDSAAGVVPRHRCFAEQRFEQQCRRWQDERQSRQHVVDVRRRVQVQESRPRKTREEQWGRRACRHDAPGGEPGLPGPEPACAELRERLGAILASA